MAILRITLQFILNLFPGEMISEEAAINDDGDALFSQWKDNREQRPWLTDKPWDTMVNEYGYLVDAFTVDKVKHELVFTGMSSRHSDGVKGMSKQSLSAFFTIGTVNDYIPEPPKARLTCSILTFDDPHREPVIKATVNVQGASDKVTEMVTERLEKLVE